MFNPIYIRADVGLGKTHLLQALAWECGGRPDRKVVYTTAEKLLYNYLVATESGTVTAFRSMVRGNDVFMIDDFQILQRRAAQADLNEVITALIDAGRQVIIASDRPPTELEGLNARTRSRLVAGLILEMSAPDTAMRKALLLSRIQMARESCPAFDVPETVVDLLVNSDLETCRALDGAVLRLLSFAKLNCTPITLDLVETQISDLIQPREVKRVLVEDVQRAVCRHFAVTRADLCSSRREREIVRPRQIAMYLSKMLAQRSLPEIGRRFGGRDHTTVLHAVRRVEALVGNDTRVAEHVDNLMQSICGEARV